MAKGNFPGMGGAGIQQMMKQAQKMQQDIAKLQEELGQRELTASVGGGAVKVTAYGTKMLKSIEIDPSCVDADDVEMLQDLVLSAVNEALRMVEEMTAAEMNKVTGGMRLGF
ncbi:MAG: Nucleoid-associated protein [Firmicutes bacterium ADurb.Bin182]|nr:MAG: Nucleoid-associated protein [Firmicutes bacterium ADurb.Bin182]